MTLDAMSGRLAASRPMVGLVLALAAGLQWGSLGLVTAQVIDLGLSPAQAGAWRLGLAALICLAVALPLRLLRWPSRQHWLPLLALGVVCQALGTWAFARAVQALGPLPAVLLFCTGPMFGALLEWLFWRVRPGGMASIAVIITFIGLGMHLGAGMSSAPAWSAAGVAWGLLAGGCYGSFAPLARPLRPLGSMTLLTASLALGALALVPAAWASPSAVRWEAPLLMWLAVLVVVPTLLADLCFVRAAQTLSAATVCSVALVEVPAAALLTRWWQETPLHAMQVGGIAVFTAGLLLLTLSARRMPPTPRRISPQDKQP